MSQERDNRNTGVLFINDKQGNKNWPDFKGRFTDSNGNEYWISGWKKTSKDGEHKFISIAATPIEGEEKSNKSTSKGKGGKATKEADPW